MRFEPIKKFLLITGAVLSVSIVSITNLRADEGAPDQSLILLQAIANNTNGILQQVNNLQGVLQAIGKLATAWITPDTSDVTSSQLAPNFSELSQLMTSDLNGALGIQSKNNAAMLTGVTKDNTPYANDLTYSTLLGQPFFSKDPRNTPFKQVDAAWNYISNASGINLVHVVPQISWQGADEDQTRYQNYYNTAMAVESFNAYVLSQQYADKNQFNDLQLKLIDQAGDPSKWMAQVASENIGWVLRQLLLFQSQSFVLMTQLVQSEKQIATASAMTNAVILTLNQQWEQNFVSKAQGTKLQG